MLHLSDTLTRQPQIPLTPEQVEQKLVQEGRSIYTFPVGHLLREPTIRVLLEDPDIIQTDSKFRFPFDDYTEQLVIPDFFRTSFNPHKILSNNAEYNSYLRSLILGTRSFSRNDQSIMTFVREVRTCLRHIRTMEDVNNLQGTLGLPFYAPSSISEVSYILGSFLHMYTALWTKLSGDSLLTDLLPIVGTYWADKFGMVYAVSISIMKAVVYNDVFQGDLNFKERGRRNEGSHALRQYREKVRRGQEKKEEFKVIAKPSVIPATHICNSVSLELLKKHIFPWLFMHMSPTIERDYTLFHGIDLQVKLENPINQWIISNFSSNENPRTKQEIAQIEFLFRIAYQILESFNGETRPMAVPFQLRT